MKTIKKLINLQNDVRTLNEKWITVKPNGEDAKGRHLLLEGHGDNQETPKQAIKRVWGVDLDKKKDNVQKNGEDKKITKQRGDYAIELETKKAYLLRKGDKSFWIQKRWLRDDNTLTKAGEEAYKEAQTDAEKKAIKEEREAFRSEGVKKPAQADYESEKAYGYDIEIETERQFPDSSYNTRKHKRHRIFIPKSVIQENGNIPIWILENKIKEADHPRDMDGKFTDKGEGNNFNEKIKTIKKELTKKLSAEAYGKSLKSLYKPGGGSGYLESGKESINAQIARSKGLATAKEISRALKKAGYNVDEYDVEELLGVEEYHHIGRNFKKVNFYDIEGLLDNDSDKELIRISKLNDKTKETKKKKMEPYKKLSDAELFQKYKEVTGDKEVTWDVTRNMFKTRSEVREYLAAIISQTLEACAGKE